MERSGPQPPEPEVPLADAAIATQIAQAAARGRGADRAPTLEQLLAAFGEPQPTPQARRRVRAALQVAGMGVRPDLLNAEPGQRLLLLPPGAGSGPTRRRALAGLGAIAAVVVVAVIAATLFGGDDGAGGRASDDLPSETSTLPETPAGEATSTTAPASTGTTTAPAVTGTGTTAAETGTTPVDAGTTPADDEAAAAAERRRRRAARIKREKRQRAATAGGTVTVRVDASVRPTFLCVEDGHGTTLFSGTLTGKKAFKARRVRMNIGLASTRVMVNGNPVRVDGSPAGLDVTRKGGARELPVGQRPCG
jgi:hypothetical protein